MRAWLRRDLATENQAPPEIYLESSSPPQSITQNMKGKLPRFNQAEEIQKLG